MVCVACEQVLLQIWSSHPKNQLVCQCKLRYSVYLMYLVVSLTNMCNPWHYSQLCFKLTAVFFFSCSIVEYFKEKIILTDCFILNFKGLVKKIVILPF